MNIKLPRVTVGELIDSLSKIDRKTHVNFSELDFVEFSAPYCGKVDVIFLQQIRRDPEGFCEISYA